MLSLRGNAQGKVKDTLRDGKVKYFEVRQTILKTKKRKKLVQVLVRPYVLTDCNIGNMNSFPYPRMQGCKDAHEEYAVHIFLGVRVPER